MFTHDQLVALREAAIPDRLQCLGSMVDARHDHDSVLAAMWRGKYEDIDSALDVVTDAIDRLESADYDRHETAFDRGRLAAARQLLGRLRALEERYGDWPGADAVQIVCDWIREHGLNPDVIEPDEEADS